MESFINPGRDFCGFRHWRGYDPIYLPVDNPVETKRWQSPRSKVKLVREEFDFYDDLPLANGGTVLSRTNTPSALSPPAPATRAIRWSRRKTAKRLSKFSTTTTGFDLILSDISMPGMDGKTMVGLIREERPDVKVIMMSGYADDFT